jgi:hypothetical protein
LCRCPSADGSPPRQEPEALGCCFCFCGAASAASIAPHRRCAERIERSGRPAWPPAGLRTERAATEQDREVSCDPGSSEPSEPRRTSWIPQFSREASGKMLHDAASRANDDDPSGRQDDPLPAIQAGGVSASGPAGRDQRGQGPSDLSGRRRWRSPPQHRPARERPKAPLASERCGRAVCCAWRSHGGGQVRPAVLAEGQAGRTQTCPNNDRPPCMDADSDSCWRQTCRKRPNIVGAPRQRRAFLARSRDFRRRDSGRGAPGGPF